ncbi:hypothetical protein Adu01nite_12790 [Paractinoplanes durhamensis]|uniref:Tr-type G domain-containing protein n=1 Tax=Paractinoplanes durhamensis TaxID=113563 RepID=A0ABQ3YQR6_9ACTN|nr:hypothetical protein Adu01nite_12790 [Actinoplanes durhamensis]
MQTLNLGILAHVDAGKTSLTERLLYAAGVIDETLIFVHKVAGEKVAYLRMFAGTLRVRDTVGADRVTGLQVFADGATRAAAEIRAGQIGTVRGLTKIKIGDPVGVRHQAARKAQFAPPSLETAVLAARRADLHAALAEPTRSWPPPVRGPAPSRDRTGPDPQNRREYLLRVVRRAGAREAS